MEIEQLKTEVKESGRNRANSHSKATTCEERCTHYEGTIELKSKELELLQSNLTESKGLHEDQTLKLNDLQQKHDSLDEQLQIVQQSWEDHKNFTLEKDK